MIASILFYADLKENKRGKEWKKEEE